LDASTGVHGLTRRTLPELERIKGIGRAKALQILAAIELGRRTLVRIPAPRVQFATPREAAVHLLPQYGARAVEHFGIVMLDAKHRLLKIVPLSVGTLDASLVHPREVFREAALAGAAAIILFHNHPSGDPSPSDDDMKLTARLVEAGNLMGIDVIDHLILADARYCSLKEMRRM
jgi:DNA repair protein RadC